MVTKQQVIKALRESHINFNALCEYEHSQVLDYLIQTFGNDQGLAADSGISKLVIFLKNQDYVLKIPYTQMFDEESYNSDLSYWEETNEGAEPQEENYYYEFCSACSDAVETSDSWDYCALECAFYEEAHKAGLEKYFAKEELYAVILDYPIYIQQKVTPLEMKSTSHSMQKISSTKKRCSELNVRCFNSTWITDFFEYYGEQEFLKLSNFLKEMNIYDLHGGNLGYLHGAPVLLDYSDFREW